MTAFHLEKKLQNLGAQIIFNQFSCIVSTRSWLLLTEVSAFYQLKVLNNMG